MGSLPPPDIAWGAAGDQDRRPSFPLQNVTGDQGQDFLRFGLADEIVGALSPDPAVTVRPFTTSRRYDGSALDLVTAGHELGVATLVTGHYMRESGALHVTIEAVDVGTNRVVWRDALNVPSGDAIAMQRELVAHVQRGLLPALGVAPSSRVDRGRPVNAEAYDLYLRSTAMSYDPLPNKQAIPMLQRATDLDPSFARAWSALGLRSYYDYSYSDGGDAAFELSQTAYHRALVEAPDMIGDAAVPLILARVERGDRVAAYRDAKALVAAWPANARAHYALAYVFRYAGLLDEATRECRAAYAIDPSERRLRTCALSFIPLGDHQAARQYLATGRGQRAGRLAGSAHAGAGREPGGRAQEACSRLFRGHCRESYAAEGVPGSAPASGAGRAGSAHSGHGRRPRTRRRRTVSARRDGILLRPSGFRRANGAAHGRGELLRSRWAEPRSAVCRAPGPAGVCVDPARRPRLSGPVHREPRAVEVPSAKCQVRSEERIISTAKFPAVASSCRLAEAIRTSAGGGPPGV